MSTDLVVSQRDQELAVRANFQPVFDIASAVQRKEAMKEFIGKILNESTPEHAGDYGVIPGTNKQKVLLKPGAEKLCTFFGLSPRFVAEQIVEDWTGAEHGGEALFYYRYKCELYRGVNMIAEAVGSCNSWEKKYRYRSSERRCPECGAAAIIKGKAEYGGGFLCFAKKGGCGAKFAESDPAITEQELGTIKNPDVADCINTCQKIAQKRALVAAVLIGTNASDSFTQDLEDELDLGAKSAPSQAEQQRETETDPLLLAIYARLEKAGDRKACFEEMCSTLDALIGKDGTDKVWDGASQKADVNKNPTAAKRVAKALYEAIKRKQPKPFVEPEPGETPTV